MRVQTGAGRLTPLFADDYSSVRVGGERYFDLKKRAGLFGGKASPERLSEEQRAFVGMYPPTPQHGSPNGWRPATGLSLFALDADPRHRDEYEELRQDMQLVISAGTVRRLEEDAPVGELKPSSGLAPGAATASSVAQPTLPEERPAQTRCKRASGHRGT